MHVVIAWQECGPCSGKHLSRDEIGRVDCVHVPAFLWHYALHGQDIVFDFRRQLIKLYHVLSYFARDRIGALKAAAQ